MPASMRSLPSRTNGGPTFSTRSRPHGGELLDPRTERSDLAKPVNQQNGLCLKAAQDDCSPRPRLARGPLARGRRTGPRDCAVDHAARKPVSVKALVLGP